MTNKQKKGILIEFEGLDCTFKETNSKALLEYIKTKTDRKCVLVSYPRYDKESSCFVRQYLSGGYGNRPEDIDPDIGMIAYALDRYDDWMTGLKDIYENGGIIIADRYTLSNIIYQGAKVETYRLAEFMSKVIKLENKTFGLPKPDIAILMDMPYEIARELMGKKNADDIHEQNDSYMKRVYFTYNHIRGYMERRQMFNNNCMAKTISCADLTTNTPRSREDIFKDIVEFVDENMKNLLKGEYRDV